MNTLHDLFFSLNNPIFIVILFVCFILTLLYVLVLKFTIPYEQKHELEKKDLEIKNERNLALFTSLSPEPVYRFNPDGVILKTNEAAEKIFGNGKIDGKDVREFIPPLREMDIPGIVANAASHIFDCTIRSREYTVRVHGVPGSGFAHAYCYDITERKENEEKLKQTQSMLRELATHLQDVEESHRNDIAMELHDNICQTLSSIKMHASTFESDFAGLEEKQVRFRSLMTSLDAVMEETRALSYNLKPPLLGDFGLVSAIQNLLNQILSKSDIRGDFRTYGMDERLNPKIEVCLYRITQELINNILKHSEAEFFSIQLFHNRSSNTVKLHVSDDGKGFDYSGMYPGGGLGLLNIRERVKSFNGELILESGGNKGTEIIIEMPLG